METVIKHLQEALSHLHNNCNVEAGSARHKLQSALGQVLVRFQRQHLKEQAPKVERLGASE